MPTPTSILIGKINWLFFCDVPHIRQIPNRKWFLWRNCTKTHLNGQNAPWEHLHKLFFSLIFCLLVVISFIFLSLKPRKVAVFVWLSYCQPCCSFSFCQFLNDCWCLLPMLKKRFGFTSHSWCMTELHQAKSWISHGHKGDDLEIDFQCGGWLCSQESVINMNNGQRMGRRPELPQVIQSG